MLWRVFGANAAVFALAFALLALSPVTIHARIRLVELVLLLAGLVVMLVVDLLLLRQALNPLGRLTRVMGTIDLLRPGQRAVGFERSSTEVLALAGRSTRCSSGSRTSGARAPGASSPRKSGAAQDRT